MSLGKKVTLNSGHQIPQLGFGTWQSAPGQVGESVYEALKAGYRHLDLATIYQNQREVAEGIKRAYKDIPGLKREDIFITSKLWNSQHRPEVVEASLDACLAELELDYLDTKLYLVHWPVAFEKGDSYFPLVANSTVEGGDVVIDDGVSIVDTWKAMTQLPKSKARSVGVSNHKIEHLEAIINGTGVVPAANQIERHPVLQSNDLIEYCQKKGIHITAYSAFGNNMFDIPLLITRPEVKEVAESVAKRTGQEVSPANVILAWSQVGGHSVIPKSVTPSRIRDNFKEVELTPEEVHKVSVLGQNPKRYNTPFAANKPRWDIDIFGEPEEKAAGHKVILSV
ncbi:Aldo/keto reductase [Penicillium italicum]|uniref:D-xylose reductase [NAD(P)H] n=1 Tax=Penicillium italicum TaxID=40296 RepID=A0A0A2L1R5_PENIT|nr:Aldo/keto reductase [Penicillium italicum]